MEWYVAGTLLMGMIIAFMVTTLPIAFAFLLANMIGALVFIGGEIGLEQVVANTTTAITSFPFVAIPLFILMGQLFFHAGISNRIFGVLDKLFGRLPGRLSYITVSGGTLFAALTGSSIANTALMGSSLLPEMTRRGYKDHLSMGPIVACGGLAIMIPPSGLGVLLGSLAQLDIGALLLAGLVPGLLLALFYALVIFASVLVDPTAAPRYDVAPVSWWEVLRLVCVNLLPMSAVIFLVVGLIVLGLATPTESAAFGVVGVLTVAAGFRSLSVEAVSKAILGAAKVSGMVFMIIIGSSTFSQLLAFSGASSGLVSWTTSFDVAPVVLLIAMFAVLVLLGLFMEEASIMLLTVPIFFPLAISLGYDPIWFGIVMLLSLEMGIATPPVGIGLFVLLGVAPKGTTLAQVSWAVLPYLMCSLLLFVLLVLFPELTQLFRPA